MTTTIRALGHSINTTSGRRYSVVGRRLTEVNGVMRPHPVYGRLRRLGGSDTVAVAIARARREYARDFIVAVIDIVTGECVHRSHQNVDVRL